MLSFFYCDAEEGRMWSAVNCRVCGDCEQLWKESRQRGCDGDQGHGDQTRPEGDETTSGSRFGYNGSSRQRLHGMSNVGITRRGFGTERES